MKKVIKMVFLFLFGFCLADPCAQTTQAASLDRLYVDNVSGNDSNVGSEDKPLKTISRALGLASGKATYSFDLHSAVVDYNVLFANVGSNDYHLIQNSPAVDRGVTLEVPFDLESTPRPQLNGFDVGAYEFRVSTNAPRNPANLRIKEN